MEFQKKVKRTPSDLRRDARENVNRSDRLRAERVSDRQRTEQFNPSGAQSKDRKQASLEAQKLRLRGELRATGVAGSEDTTVTAQDLGMMSHRAKTLPVDALLPEGSGFAGKISMRGSR